MEDMGQIAVIVALAAYSVAAAALADYVATRARNAAYLRRLAVLLAVVGLAPALWLNFPAPQLKLASPPAGIVTVLCFAATGALIGSLIDLAKGRDQGQPTWLATATPNEEQGRLRSQAPTVTPPSRPCA